MTCRIGIVLGVLCLFASNLRANDVVSNITGTGGTAFFGALHTDSLDFTDIFTYTAAGSVQASASLVTIGAGANNIDFLSADLNGTPLTFTPTGFLETGSLGTTSFTGPLALTVRGKSNAAGGTHASYSGTMNVALIPEPVLGTAFGLSLAGWVALACRRQRA